MFNKYFKIKSCFDRVNEKTKKEEFVIIASEIMGKGLLRDFNQYFALEKEDFMQKFSKYYEKDTFNRGLEGKILQVGVEYSHSVNGIVDSLPEDKK